jgi:hypothetical protein
MKEIPWFGVGPILVALWVRGPSLVTSLNVTRPGSPSPPEPGGLTSDEPNVWLVCDAGVRFTDTESA